MKVSFRHRVGINNFSSYKSFNLTLLRGATGTPIARTSRTKKGVGSGAREGACSLARCGFDIKNIQLMNASRLSCFNFSAERDRMRGRKVSLRR